MRCVKIGDNMKGTQWRERERVVQAGWPGSARAGGCELTVSPGSTAGCVVHPGLAGSCRVRKPKAHLSSHRARTGQAASIPTLTCICQPGAYGQSQGLSVSAPISRIGIVNPASA